MKTFTLAILIFVIATYSYPIHAGIRCENDIISIGETSSEVVAKLSKCGQVLNKEVIRKETSVETDKSGEKVKKEKLIELWYIRVKERGGMYCYPLTFEEGRLQGIGNWRRCD